ncbi:hypothetical protein GCM10010174_03580 [Kutzneria viridogrisea]|uniref:FxLD family lantipeptide n=1 Tax=Kutzneria viridogrisea TaxID=47990 RepID=A0ABR6BRB7_9PSEU|nr:FxLD family lantipeptide [Kutzneria viridogrisea]
MNTSTATTTDSAEFNLDLRIVTDEVPGMDAACTTNDGCAPTCASSCASAV